MGEMGAGGWGTEGHIKASWRGTASGTCWWPTGWLLASFLGVGWRWGKRAGGPGGRVD